MSPQRPVSATTSGGSDEQRGDQHLLADRHLEQRRAGAGRDPRRSARPRTARARGRSARSRRGARPAARQPPAMAAPTVIEERQPVLQPGDREQPLDVRPCRARAPSEIAVAAGLLQRLHDEPHAARVEEREPAQVEHEPPAPAPGGRRSAARSSSTVTRSSSPTGATTYAPSTARRTRRIGGHLRVHSHATGPGGTRQAPRSTGCGDAQRRRAQELRRSTVRRSPRAISSCRAASARPSVCSQESVQVSVWAGWNSSGPAKVTVPLQGSTPAKLIDPDDVVARRGSAERRLLEVGRALLRRCRRVSPRRRCRRRPRGRPSCPSRWRASPTAMRIVALALSIPAPLGTVISVVVVARASGGSSKFAHGTAVAAGR